MARSRGARGVAVSERLVVTVPDLSVPPPKIRQRVLPAEGALTMDQYEACVLAWIEGSRSAKGIESVVPTVSKEKARRAIEIGEPVLGLGPIGPVAEQRIRDRTMAMERARSIALDESVKAEVVQHKTRVTDAAEQAASEVRMVRGTRATAMALQQTLAQLLKASIHMAQEITSDITNGDVKLSIRERMGIIRNVAQIAQRTADVSRTAVNMERLLLGDPTSIVGHLHAPAGSAAMTPEQADQWFDMAIRAGERANARIAASVDDDDPEYTDQPLITD